MKNLFVKAVKIVLGVILGGIIGTLVDVGVDRAMEFVGKKKEKAHD